jgi:hypothetical protein
MSKIEVDAIEPQSGTTLTIGASGDSVNIASGATITDFTSTGIDDNATSTAITIDSSENVGIGETSPLGKLHVKSADSGGTPNTQYDELVLEQNGNNCGMTILCNSPGDGAIYFGDSADNDIGGIAYSHFDNKMFFKVNGSERIRIDSNGSLNVAKANYANNVSATNAGWELLSNGNDPFIQHGNTGTGATTRYNFFNANGVVGSISTNGSATAYNTSSDYRLKENVNYNFDATTRLKQLKPARFNFKTDSTKTFDGFLAHEVQDIIPEAIHGIKDATETKEKVVVNSNGKIIAENIEQADWETGKIADEDGNTKYPTDSTWEATKVVPIYQGIDQAKLVPLLVKTIQELEARITTLENA